MYGQITADFSALSATGCTPLNVQFKDLSSGNPTQWVWDFGNGTSSNLQNPVATYITGGTYTVRLIVKNASSKNYIEKKNLIIVSATPDVEFTASNNTGCLPLIVSFDNTTNLFGNSIKSWLWDFGDGNTSNQQAPSHTYTARGVYDVSLTVENVSGCTNSLSLKKLIRAGNKPNTASFKATPLDGCASSLRNFTDLSTGTINSWQWDFGDGGTSDVKNPSYHYIDTGFFSVNLIVGDNGCSISTQINNYVHIIGPIADIHKSADCSNPYNISFFTPFGKADSWFWDFGDGKTSNSKNEIHTYSKTGKYVVKLNISGGACVDSANDTIYVVNQTPTYNILPSAPSYCKNDTLEFTANNYDSAGTKYFAWSFDGGLTLTKYRAKDTIQNVYLTTGIYPAPILYISNKEGCTDTIQKNQITITGAVAGFSNSFPTCIGNAITFSDKSILYKNSPIKQWEWNYGDGDTVTTSASFVNYTYPFPGLYTTLLKITDADGCTDTISHEINIADTPTIDAGNDMFTCAGKSVTLQPSGGVNYMWDSNSSLSCTNCNNPIATPLDTTVFYVSGRNAAGCAARDSIQINVQQKQEITVQPSFGTICKGNSIQLSASGSDSYSWQPTGSLNNSDISNPLATPQSNTTYIVSGSDKNGCFTSTANIDVAVKPQPEINITDSAVTLQPGQMYQLKTTYSSDVVKWTWQPAQWLTDASIPNPVTQPQGNITYKVTAETESGCIDSDKVVITVVCNNSILFIPNTFSPNKDGMNDYFYPRSSGQVKIKSLKIFNRWGQEVYKKTDFFTNDQNAGWDGKYNGNFEQADAYVYVLLVSCSNGSFFRNSGSITLIR